MVDVTCLMHNGCGIAPFGFSDPGSVASNAGEPWRHISHIYWLTFLPTTLQAKQNYKLFQIALNGNILMQSVLVGFSFFKPATPIFLIF